MKYEQWIDSKATTADAQGLTVETVASHLYPHQIDLVKWALRRGRAAIFADTGLGKTAMQIEWARIVSEHNGGRVLILAPLAVAEQTVREAQRFGVAAKYLRKDDGDTRIVVTNYDMLEHFDASAFAGVVLDESSILKAYTGAFRNLIIESFERTPFKLACTATPAPNDFTELGNHSEFLGVKSRVEMLSEYFCHDGGSTQDWRLKGHAEETFWRWVCSWGAVVKRPSDLGHADDGFALPPLRMHEHVIPVDHTDAFSQGLLFAPDARTLSDQRKTRRMTLEKRVSRAVALAGETDQCIIWCELNDESDAIAKAIPGAVEVKGSDSPEHKSKSMLGFAAGDMRVLVSKSSICGFGMNFQSCASMVFVGASHSYEQTYQAIRRCWRFGQKRPVDVHIIRAETEGAIVENFKRKEADAERMGAEMTSRMIDTMRAEVVGARREWNAYNPKMRMVVPSWVGEEAA